jgi:sugar (pentulose or hexulose) kinase
MNPAALMGVDLGTSSTKTVLIDATGRLLSVAAREYPVDTPCPGYKQDPESGCWPRQRRWARRLIGPALIPRK